MSFEALFTPFNAAGVQLRNRVVMAPMTRGFSPGGVPMAGMPAYYRRRAAGGVGLILSEGVAPPHKVAEYNSRTPRLDEDTAAIWGEVVDGVHADGAAMFAQLWHTGLGRLTEQTPNPQEPSIGPSGIFPEARPPFRAATETDIAEVIEAFARAAALARRIGFDGVNIHAAHGYLIDEFFWSETNRRVDAWGGDLVARTRFACEIVRAIKRAAGADYPVMLRFSQWKGVDYAARPFATPDDLARFLAPLVDAGVDIFDPSQRRFWLAEFPDSALSLAGWTKRLTGKPTMTIGSITLETPHISRGEERLKRVAVAAGNLEKLMAMFAAGEFDLVGIGRAMLANPELPAMLRKGDLAGMVPYDPACLAHLEPADFYAAEAVA